MKIVTSYLEKLIHPIAPLLIESFYSKPKFKFRPVKNRYYRVPSTVQFAHLPTRCVPDVKFVFALPAQRMRDQRVSNCQHTYCPEPKND